MIDDNAAGYGWSVGGVAAERMDLLTAVVHEMGHIGGLPDDGGDGLMDAMLAPGTRHLDALDAAFASLSRGDGG